jgi:polysaccharide export outer membrane protein
VLVLPGDRLVIPEPKQVFVDGKVGKPGPYVYRDGMTITQALATAGGASETANTTRVQIRRGLDRVIVNVRRILAGNAADMQLRPGDIVYVPESIF